jgi:formylglycine-generating enzyme required for sulfatase activity
MGGNGWEWTQDVVRGTRRVRVPLSSLRPGDQVWLRSLSYTQDEPLDVVRLRSNPQLPQFPLTDPFQPEQLAVTGFRVVIEP